MSLAVNTMEFLSSLQAINIAGKTKPGVDADWADQIAGGVTNSLLLVLAIFIGAKQYFGNVIDCWTPQEFTGSMDTYVKEFCFVNRCVKAAINPYIFVNVNCTKTRIKSFILTL